MVTVDSSKLLMRRALPADGLLVRDFVFATLRSYGVTPDPDGLDAGIVNFGASYDPDLLEYVAELDGHPAGSVVLAGQAGGVAHLGKFFVDAHLRGRGIGRALLAYAVAEARARGYLRLELETRTVMEQAIHLYEATGWTRGPDLPPGPGPDRTYYLDLTHP